MAPEQQESVLPVRCRPDKGWWAAIAIFGGIGFVTLISSLFPQPRPQDPQVLRTLGALYLVPVSLLAVWAGRAQVVADKIGLRWRGLGKWRAVRWHEVSDYYEALVPGKAWKRDLVVQTRRGRLRLSRDTWGKGIEALRAPIQQRASHAGTSQWEVLGTRPQDEWPRVFHYRTADNRCPWVMLIGLAGLWCYLVWDKWHRFPNDPGWIWNVVGFGMMLLLFLPMAWLMVGVSTVNRPRLGQRITASLQGLVLRTGRRGWRHPGRTWRRIIPASPRIPDLESHT